MLRTLLALTLLALPASAQWQLQDAHTTADLRGIDNVGNGVAWASGTNGTILRTEDAGIVWQLCAKPPGGEHLDFRAIQAFNNNTAIIMSSGKGDLSRLYKTTDGCQSWKLIFTNPDKEGFWDALIFEPPTNRVSRGLDHRLGGVLGDPVNGSFPIFITYDGGSHWTRQVNRGLQANASRQGAFAASNTSLYLRGGFVAFGSGGIAGATIYIQPESFMCQANCPASDLNLDGSKNKWLSIEVPVGGKSVSSGIFSISCKDNGATRAFTSRILVAVGGDYNRPGEPDRTAAFSPDGGLYWLPADTPPHGYRSAVAYDSKTKTWITVGPSGTDISTDDGRNWRALKPDPKYNDTSDADRHWNALSLPYVVGPHGRIGKLRDGALKP